MPKKMPKDVNRRFKASVERQYQEQSAARRYAESEGIYKLCDDNLHLQTDENPFVNRVLASYNKYRDMKSKLSDIEKGSAAARIKQEHGIKLGFREKWSLKRSEKKAAKLEAKMERAYTELRNYSIGMMERSQPGSEAHAFFNGVNYGLEQANGSVEHDIDTEAIEQNAFRESGYQPELTAEEQAERDSAKAARKLAKQMGIEMQEQEELEDAVDYDDPSLVADKAQKPAPTASGRRPVAPEKAGFAPPTQGKNKAGRAMAQKTPEKDKTLSKAE